MFKAGANFFTKKFAQLKEFYSIHRARARLKTRGWHLSSFKQNTSRVENLSGFQTDSDSLQSFILRAPEVINGQLPITVAGPRPEKIKRFFERFLRLELPECLIARIPEASLYGRVFSVIHGKNVFHECFWNSNRIIKGIPSPDTQCEKLHGRYLLLGFEHWHGYYHWLTDILPRLQILEEADWLKQLILLIPKLNRDFQRESLKLLLPPNVVIQEFDETFCKVDELYFLSLLNPIGFSSARNVDWMRKKLCTPNPTASDRIYISRRMAKLRRISNEAELMPWLESEGFKIVCLETLSFEEQIQLFQSAKMILAPHGAGLTNMIFMPPGGTIIELFPPEFPKNNIYQCYWSMAGASDHHYSCISGSQQDLKTLDFQIQLDDLKFTFDSYKN